MESAREQGTRAAVAAAAAALHQRLAPGMTRAECEAHAPWVVRIQELKRERRAVVLAHNYMAPEIFHGVADLKGDSLALAYQAAETDAEVVVVAGVHFMAETAKLVSPEKTVLCPDLRAGCSLAASITAADVRALRQQHPGVPVVTYVNTSAAVKAESDICCTSGNAVQVVRSLGVPRVIFLPDAYLGQWVAAQSGVELILWQGHCEVHERFSGEQLRTFRAAHPGVRVLAHPECPPDALAEADYVGSTAEMIRYVGAERPPRVALITECSMSDNVAAGFPELEFVRPCTLCPHMKRLTLPNIASALERLEQRVEIEPALAERARAAVERMLAITSSAVSSAGAPRAEPRRAAAS
ncbi:MAG: quinolinate synthase NadA [Proteobacteria bacterium]|nr:quinolinate synthase NadA [Pseudomonadota bacterium]